MKLYIASIGGDYRLELDKATGFAVLTVENPTPGERVILARFLSDCVKRGWLSAERMDLAARETIIAGLFGKVARCLMKAAAPPRGRRLIAVASKNDYVQLVDDYPMTETSTPGTAVAVMPKPERSLFRPRDPLHHMRATEVMRAFVRPDQFAAWMRCEAFVARGSVSGARYLVAHREGPTAERYGSGLIAIDNVEVPLTGRITACYRSGDGVPVWCPTVPAEEAVLATALMVEHRERELIEIAHREPAPDAAIGVAALLGATISAANLHM